MEAIILAAGLSSRMGEDKAFLLYKNRPIIDLLVNKISEFCDHIVVVGGKNYQNLNMFFAATPIAAKLDIVYNDHYQEGMFSSIKVGVDALSGNSPFFLQMIDQPFVVPEIYKRLSLEYDPDYLVLQPQALKDGNVRNGHPLLINPNLIETILAEPNTSNLRIVIHRIPEKRNFLLVKNTTIFDNLNTRSLFLEKVKKVEDGDSSS